MSIFQISGFENVPETPPHVWFAYARSKESAEHLKRLFSAAGYQKVSLKEVDPKTLIEGLED